MRLLGFWKVTVGNVSQSFIMFNNVLPVDLSIDEKFDLKANYSSPSFLAILMWQGSTKDRSASKSELRKEVPVLLDRDFLAQQRTFNIGPKVKTALLESLKADVEARLAICKTCLSSYFCSLAPLFLQNDGLQPPSWHS